MKKKPRVCFGLTLFNNSKYLGEAIESLLNQTYNDFCIVAIDDCSDDSTDDIMQEYAKKDERISYFRNEQRNGMVNTWRDAFLKAKELYEPDYFAWASDHDIWHPEWLEYHVDTLNENPNVVLSYPDVVAIDINGNEKQEGTPLPFETTGMIRLDRYYHVCRHLSGAGNKIYGLFRSDALEKAGIFRSVTLPDRLLIVEICKYGQFKHIPKKLWYRRFFGSVKSYEETLDNQIKKLFGTTSPPFYVNFPYMAHFTNLAFSVNDDNTFETFSSRFLLAMIYWEANNTDILNEIAKLGDFLNIEIKNNATLQQPFELITTGTGMIQGAIASRKNSCSGTGDFINTLIFGVLLITKYLNPPKNAGSKLEKKHFEIENLEYLLDKYKKKLSSSREAETILKSELESARKKAKNARADAEYWKSRSPSGILGKLVKKTKGFFKG